LTGRSIAQSRLSLLFNAVAKIPMQFFILFTGAMVFVFYTFNQPPMLFEQRQLERIQTAPEYRDLESRYSQAFQGRRRAAARYVDSRSESDREAYRSAHGEFEKVRAEAGDLVRSVTGDPRFNDTNYIFLTFVTTYLPAGVVGLILAAIFAAAMSTI